MVKIKCWSVWLGSEVVHSIRHSLNVNVFNLYTYVWMTAVNKWQCFHFSWVKSVFCDHSYLWLENNFSHITRIDGRCHNDWQTDSIEPWSHLSSLNIWRLWGSPTKPTLDESFFSSELNFSTENHWPLLIKWIALLDVINRLNEVLHRKKPRNH